MKKNNKTCCVCNTKYTYCPNCEGFAHLQPWHTIYHDENCKDIFEVLNAYAWAEITKDEAKVRLDKLDLSEKENYNKVLRIQLQEIYGKDFVSVTDEESNAVKEVKESLEMASDEVASTSLDDIKVVEESTAITKKLIKKK